VSLCSISVLIFLEFRIICIGEINSVSCSISHPLWWHATSNDVLHLASMLLVLYSTTESFGSKFQFCSFVKQKLLVCVSCWRWAGCSFPAVSYLLGIVYSTLLLHDKQWVINMSFFYPYSCLVLLRTQMLMPCLTLIFVVREAAFVVLVRKMYVAKYYIYGKINKCTQITNRHNP
jgi:hypothetical protein